MLAAVLPGAVGAAVLAVVSVAAGAETIGVTEAPVSAGARGVVVVVAAGGLLIVVLLVDGCEFAENTR